MWQRFSEHARQAVFHAQEEAQRLGEGQITVGLLLLGVLRESECTAVHALEQLGVSIESLRTEIEAQVTKSESHTRSDLALNPKAKRAIDLAYDEARQLSHNYIGTEHLLLGIIRQAGSKGNEVKGLEVPLEEVRSRVIELTARNSPPTINPSQLGQEWHLVVGPRRTMLPASSADRPKPGAWKRAMLAIFGSAGQVEKGAEPRLLLSDRLIKVLSEAKNECQRLRQSEVSPAVVLLTLATSEHGAKQLFDDLGVDTGRMVEAIEQELAVEQKFSGVKPEVLARAELNVISAFEWARYFKREVAQPEDLVLAMVHGRDTFARRVLMTFGASYEAVREKVQQISS